MHRLPSLALALTLGGCVHWGDANDWERAPSDVVSWDWIDGAALRDPPMIDQFGLNQHVVTAEYITQLLERGVEPFCTVEIGRLCDDEGDWDAFVARSDASAAAGPGAFLTVSEFAGRACGTLDPRGSSEFLDLIVDRFALCADMGFSRVAVQGRLITEEVADGGPTLSDWAAYYNALLDEIAAMGVGAIQLRAPELAEELEPRMDALLLEDCRNLESDSPNSPCRGAARYLEAGKPVLNVLFVDGLGHSQHGGPLLGARLCPSGGGAEGLSVIVKSIVRDSRTIVCAALP